MPTPAFDVCGMVVDHGRGAYTAPFRFDDGSKGKIRYYFATPGAQVLLIPHGLKQKRYWKQDKPGPTGEYGKRKGHAGLNYLELPGDEFHGPPAAFVSYAKEPHLTPCGLWHLGLCTGSTVAANPQKEWISSACDCDDAVSLWTSSPVGRTVISEACDCDDGVSVWNDAGRLSEACDCDDGVSEYTAGPEMSPHEAIPLNLFDTPDGEIVGRPPAREPRVTSGKRRL